MKKTRIFAILLTLALAVTLLAPGARAIDLAEVSG